MLNLLRDSVGLGAGEEKWEEEDEEGGGGGGGGSGWSPQLNISSSNVTDHVIVLWRLLGRIFEYSWRHFSALLSKNPFRVLFFFFF